MARKTAMAAGAAATPRSRETAGKVIKHKATSPMVRLADMRANSSLRMSVARAKMVEKMVHMKASISRSFSNLRHPINPVYKTAAKERARERKAAATERRRVSVAAAQQIAARKRAAIRERRAREMQRSVY